METMGDARPGRLSYSASRLDDKRKRVTMPVHDNYEAISAPEGNRQAIRRFDLLNLSAGETLEITTRSSTYWVTATNHLRPFISSSVEIRGASVATNSVRARDFDRSPDNTLIGRYVEIGERFVIGRKGELTPPVESISIK